MVRRTDTDLQRCTRLNAIKLACLYRSSSSWQCEKKGGAGDGQFGARIPCQGSVRPTAMIDTGSVTEIHRVRLSQAAVGASDCLREGLPKASAGSSAAHQVSGAAPFHLTRGGSGTRSHWLIDGQSGIKTLVPARRRQLSGRGQLLAGDRSCHWRTVGLTLFSTAVGSIVDLDMGTGERRAPGRAGVAGVPLESTAEQCSRAVFLHLEP